MSNEHNIDKLLKESFDNFSPEAPDVWQAVQQGVQAAQASAAASSGVSAAAVQGVSLTVKVIAGIAIAAASVTGYVLFKNQENKDTVKVADPVVKEQIVNKPETPAEINQTIKEEMITPAPPKNNTKTISQSTSVAAEQHPKAEEVNSPVSTSVSSDPKTIVPATEPQNNEVHTPVVTKEAVVTETPKSVPTSATKDTNKGEVSKQVTKVKPYNPYAEEGEIYDKPTIPGAFSPNDDGLNDKFEIKIENETFYSLKILNEKGEMVFESKSSDHLWDGKHYKTGQQCPAGNYIYVLKYQYKGSEKVHEKSALVGLFL